MRMTYRDKRRLFYVVQFIEVPFEGIDDYVCVPYSWLIKQKSSDQKVVVTYPHDEDPLDTRDRVKRVERPNDDWRFYTAYIKFESDNYKNADFWIATRNEYGHDEETSKIKDVQAASVLNRKLRSASQSLWSDPNSDKRQLTVKPYKNLRKPLPKISIKRPLSKSPKKNMDNKRLKLDPDVKPGSDTDQEIIASGCSKQKQLIIIADNQLIQEKTKTSFASNSDMNSDQSTQPGVIKNNQSVYMSVQSSSNKLLAEQQPSPKLSDEQKLPPQLSTNQQPSLKLTDGQDFSPKLPDEQKLSPVGQEYQQPLSMSVIDLVECEENIESCQNVLLEPVTEKRTLTKTPLSTLEQAPQAEPINERSTLLVRPEHSHPEPYPRGVSVRQSKEPDDSHKTYLNQILTAPQIIPRPPSTANQPIQQYAHSQVPILPVSSILYSNPKPQEMDERNSINVFHHYQKPHSEDSMQSTPSPFHLEPNRKKLSQPSTSLAKKQIPVLKKLKKYVDKKTHLESITKNITTMQYPPNSTMHLTLPGGSAVKQTEPLAQNHLQSQQALINSSLLNNVRGSMGEECVDQKNPLSERNINTPAAQNLSKFAHQYSSFVEAARKQQYSSIKDDYLQQFVRMQDMLTTPSMAQTIDQRVHHQNGIINNGLTIQSQPNPIEQRIQFLPPNYNQCIPVNGAYAQGVIRHGLTRGSIDGVHTTYTPIVQNGVNIQLTANNSLHQSYQNSEHPQQEQDPPNYQDPGTSSTHYGLSLQSKQSSQILRSQRVTEKPRSPSTLKTPVQALSDAQKSYLFRKMNLQSRVNQSYTEYNNINLADVRGNFTVDPVPTTQDSKVQTMLSSNQKYERQSNIAQFHYAYQQPHTKKTMVDQSTETDSIEDVDHCVDKLAGSPVGEITPRVVDSACQTDEWLSEKQGSLYEETTSDSTNETDSDIESENEVMSEANETTLATVENLTPNNQEIQSRIDIEQDMLSIFGTLFTQMGANLSFTRDMFDNLRNSMLVCGQTYEKLLDQVDKFNSIETFQIPTSSSNNVPSQVSQVTQERLEVDDAPTPIREQKGTFSLPKEYDPNDTKWTLKYQKYKPGLLELIPRTGVYVSKKILKRSTQKSTDCRTLARLLLTEVFSKKALSVCSLTGGRAKAFNSVNIDVRPGLDEHARMVLLAFVEEYGNKHGWITSDTPAVMSSIRTKINEIRAKHGQTCEV
uniref:BEN domain-containing protein n=1 Tax=Glyptapanteles flavicoxis TaxID=463051 RepID=B7S8L8_9HYME|nr:conserved hypothetical protein [Glyptapanteles flavicoxis]